MEDTKQSDDEKKAHNSEDQPAITSSRNNTNKTPETSEPPDSKTSNGAKAANSNGSWTKQQDEKIKSMKGVNSSWKNIAAAVGATKKDVTQRYQELMDAAKDPSATDSAHGAATNSNSDTHVAESLPMMSGALDGDAWLASRDSLCQTLGDPGTSNTAAARDKSSKSRPDGSKVSQACQAQESTATAAATNAIPTSTNAFPTGAELAELLKGYPGLLCHQPLYPLSALNNDGSLGADKSPWTIRTGGDWTECECAMLEKVLRRYENNKWLHIQAGLFNMTGRMVDGEVIRQKVEVDRVKGSG